MDIQEIKFGNVVLVVQFTDYIRSIPFANIEAVHHCDIDITDVIDIGVVAHELTKFLAAQYEEEMEARAFEDYENRRAA